MCALTFFAFLHVGEITATSLPGNCPIQLKQLTKLSRDGEVIGYKLIYYYLQHDATTQSGFAEATAFDRPTLQLTVVTAVYFDSL
jgi:hypothetical protein